MQQLDSLLCAISAVLAPASLVSARLRLQRRRYLVTPTDTRKGGPTAAVIAFHNPLIRVTVVDRDEKRVRRWNSKHPPIYEPGLNDILRIARDGSRECAFSGGPTGCDAPGGQCADQADGLTSVAARQPNLVFTTDVAKCVSEADVVLIAVNTPTKSRGNGAGSATDMAAFEAVTAVVAQHASPGTIIVEKSTVPCRTAQLVQDTASHTFFSSSFLSSSSSKGAASDSNCPD